MSGPLIACIVLSVVSFFGFFITMFSFANAYSDLGEKVAFVLMVIFFLGFCACLPSAIVLGSREAKVAAEKEEQTAQAFMDKYGLLEPVQVVRTDRALGQYGQVSGYFFFGSGGISGEIGAQTVISFTWMGKDGNMRIVDIPASLMIIHIDDSVASPTVQFDFIYDELHIWWHVDWYRLTNPSLLLTNDYLELATVSMSTDDFNNSPFAGQAPASIQQ